MEGQKCTSVVYEGEQFHRTTHDSREALLYLMRTCVLWDKFVRPRDEGMEGLVYIRL